jgi:hypothetical protein
LNPLAHRIIHGTEQARFRAKLNAGIPPDSFPQPRSRGLRGARKQAAIRPGWKRPHRTPSGCLPGGAGTPGAARGYLMSPRWGFSRSPSTIYHLPSTIYHLPSTIYHLPSTIYHLPSTIYHLPSTIYHPRDYSGIVTGGWMPGSFVSRAQVRRIS